MNFKCYTIAPRGRNKYGTYMASSNITNKVTRTIFGGDASNNQLGGSSSIDSSKYNNFPYKGTDGYWYVGDVNTNIAVTDDPNNNQWVKIKNGTWWICDATHENDTEIAPILSNDNPDKYSNWSVFLSKTSNVFDITSGASDYTIVVAYHGKKRTPTFIGDLSNTAQTSNYGISGITEGISVTVSGNGTEETTVHISISSAYTYTEGRLIIPVNVYVGEDPMSTVYEDWYDSAMDCITLNLEYGFSTLSKGEKGDPGRAGAAVRGPVIWEPSDRRWCSGEETEGGEPEDALWIDVIYYAPDGENWTYYRCIESYDGSDDDSWAAVERYWEEAETFDFVASKLILAQNASIDFLTNNELYLKDSDGEITAGAAGGDGINFWAGSDSPSLASFRVTNDGTMTAEKGKFGCVEIGDVGPYDDALVAEKYWDDWRR